MGMPIYRPRELERRLVPCTAFTETRLTAGLKVF
jgi:hypothetical protein